MIVLNSLRNVTAYFFLTCCVLLIFTSFGNSQCMTIPIAVTSQINDADAVIEGEVVQTRCFFSEDKGNIYTAYRVRATKLFKGEMSAQEFDIIAPGGRVGDYYEEVTPRTELRVGDRATFMLGDLPDVIQNRILPEDLDVPHFRCYASQQSVFYYDEDGRAVQNVYRNRMNRATEWYQFLRQEIGQDMQQLNDLQFHSAQSLLLTPSITSISPTTISAGTSSVLTISGSGFGNTQGDSRVRFHDPDDGGASWVEADILYTVSWSDNQIQIEVPPKSGSGTIQVVVGGQSGESSQSLTVPYHIAGGVINAAGTDYKLTFLRSSQNAEGGYTFEYFTDFFSNAPAKDAFERALKTWNCAMAVNFTTATSATNTDVTARDGTNVVRFDNGSELPAGVLGRNTYYFAGCFRPDIGIHILEIDHTYNDNYVWYYGAGSPPSNQNHFESVAAHEVGHGVGLGHVISSNEIMYFSYTQGTINTTLSSNDVDGGLFHQHQSTTAIPFCAIDPAVDYDHIDLSCKNSIYQLDATGAAVVNANEVASAVDNICGHPLTVTIDPINLTPSDVGFANIDVLATAPSSDEETCTSQVMVLPYYTKAYVDHTASGTGEGSSWTNAFTDLSDACQAAAHGFIDTIYVAAGTYYPDEGYTKVDNDRGARFEFTLANTAIIGGYPNGGGAYNPAQNETILSGEIQQDATLTNNSYTIGISIQTSGVVLRGLTFTGGYANDPSQVVLRTGAGLYNWSSMDIYDCKFYNNWAVSNGVGGAIAHFSGTLNVYNSLFYDNHASGNGGAITSEGGNLNLRNTTISNNTANLGGGLHMYLGNITAYNCIIANNTGTNANMNDGSVAFGGIGSIGNSVLDSPLPPEIVDLSGNVLNSSNIGFQNEGMQDYRLTYGSDCINVGTAAQVQTSGDIVGTPRIINNLPDAGCYEFNYVMPCGSASSLTVDDNPVYTGTYRATTSITSSGSVSIMSQGPVKFSSEEEIDLLTPFEVGLGAEFTATIENPCVD